MIVSPLTQDTRQTRIGYQNLGALGSVVSTNLATGYEGFNLFDYHPYTYWLPSVGGINSVTVTLPGAMAVNYFAVAQHTLNQTGGTILLQSSTDGVTWTNVPGAAAAPNTGDAIYLSFPQVLAAYWRVQVQSDPPAAIAIVYFGQDIMPLYGQIMGSGSSSGWTPPKTARDIKLYVSETESGRFLGRSILRKAQRLSISWDHQDPGYIYNVWYPFMQFAEQYPFFVQWNNADYAFDSMFAQSDGPLPMPAYTRPLMMNMSLNLIGLLT